MCGWAAMGERGEPSEQRGKAWGGGLSVWLRLIALEFRNGFRIGGVEPIGLIEPKMPCGGARAGDSGGGRVGEIEM